MPGKASLRFGLLAVVAVACVPWDGAPARAQDAAPPAAIGEFEALLPPAEPVPAATLDAATLDAATVDPELLDATTAPTPLWYYPSYWFGPEPWTAGLELGINGSEGNNNVLSLRTGGHLKRETKRWKLDSTLAYNKNHSNGVETQNNGKADLRLDRILAESAWTLFVLENLIYDEFQAYDVQLSLNTGVGYRVVDTEIVDLMTRVGAGATREFGGVENDWQPQALFGLEYEEKISKTQRIVAKVDYFPEWEDYRNYRVVTDVGWQIDLDRPKNVSLKLSLVDRYDSTPDGVEPNNFDYAVLLIWGL
jgi:putative salt-induced outer membrane protein YdiY